MPGIVSIFRNGRAIPRSRSRLFSARLGRRRGRVSCRRVDTLSYIQKAICRDSSESTSIAGRGRKGCVFATRTIGSRDLAITGIFGIVAFNLTFACAMKRRLVHNEKHPAENWFAPPDRNRSGSEATKLLKPLSDSSPRSLGRQWNAHGNSSSRLSGGGPTGIMAVRGTRPGSPVRLVSRSQSSVPTRPVAPTQEPTRNPPARILSARNRFGHLLKIELLPEEQGVPKRRVILPPRNTSLLAPTSARGTNKPTLLGKSDPAPHPPTSLGSHPPSRTISDTGRLSAAARFGSAAIASNCFTAR